MDCSFCFEMISGGLSGLIAQATDPATVAAAAEASGITTGAGVPDAPSGWGPWIAVAIAAAVIIGPFLLGNFLSKSMKMPQMATRLGCILLALIASGVVLLNKLPGLGVDLRGGTILVYEIDSRQNEAKQADGGDRITGEDLVEALTNRINPAGTQEIVIRPYGETQVEIIIPEVDQREVDRVKKVIEEAGILRFAIVANQSDHQSIIDQAVASANSNIAIERLRQIVGPTGIKYGRWVSLGRESGDSTTIRPYKVGVDRAIVRNPETGQLINPPLEVLGSDDAARLKLAQWSASQGLSGIEILMVINPLLDIKGEDLSFATGTYDERGAPAIAFNLTDLGSGRFRALTTNNAPDGTRQRQLGIVLDDTLLSAPTINEPISKQGRITGQFTRDEVDKLVSFLEAGQLPAALLPQPIAENQVGATLGSDTITKGTYSIVGSLLLVLVFILIYYRFAGVIACIALVMNLAMILATMVLINQPLTLPGLAGLVLTVGMSVDANVLIFERIREELKKGAKPRMAIRNGFGRATTTIVDANLTTLITAIVLYAIGTDQIRGFAVTLILGILYSMFTAIFVSRTFFDIAEKKGFLSLGMSDSVNAFRSALAGGGQFDFVSKGRFTLMMSAVLVAVGIASLFARGKSIYDIDFAGGSSVQFRLTDSVAADEVRRIVNTALNSTDGEQIQSTVNGVSIEGIPDGTVFKVDASIEQVDDLKSAIEKGFAEDAAADLVKFNIAIKPLDKPEVTEESSARVKQRSQRKSASNGVMLTMAYAQEDDAAVADEQAPETAADAPAKDGKPATEAEPAADGEPELMEVEFPELRFSESVIQLGLGENASGAAVNFKTLTDRVVESSVNAGIPMEPRQFVLTPIGEGAKNWNPESSLTFDQWKIRLPFAADKGDKLMEQLTNDLGSEPAWISSSSVGKRVAGDMIGRALGALFASLLCIIAYIWFRFQKVMYGLAAVAALLHDVLITLGAIAISYWLADALGFLLIDPFKISLTVVAALLTIIGYSLNDTIVVFDRIRETKGKAPRLTGDMINTSINQTLSRTLLTSITTLIVVVLLYAFGGAGIHAFAFALVIGVLVGTYSSVFVASPILLWLVNREAAKA